MTIITIPKKLVKKDNLIVLEKKDFEMLKKENNELREALKAVAAGELALRKGRTRTLKNFLASQFPRYAKNK